MNWQELETPLYLILLSPFHFKEELIHFIFLSYHFPVFILLRFALVTDIRDI
jgi:hypothetical protein